MTKWIENLFEVKILKSYALTSIDVKIKPRNSKESKHMLHFISKIDVIERNTGFINSPNTARTCTFLAVNIHLLLSH